MRVCTFFLDKISNFFDILHGFLGLTVTKLSSLKTVRFFSPTRYVPSVEDSTLMPIFDQFSLSFVFPGLPKIGPNPYT